MFNPAEFQGDFQFTFGSTSWSSSQLQKLVGANPNRVILYIRLFGANGWDLQMGQALNITPQVWHYASNVTVSFTWVTDGPLPSQEWWALPETPLAAAQASWCEVRYSPE